MQTFFVTLSSIPDVKRFVDAATGCACEIDVLSGRYVVDAQSIMGLFSLDLQKPVRVEFHGTDEECAAFQAKIASSVVTPGK
jgi:phosphotransferase system HPr-like phosphotransfer protein